MSVHKKRVKDIQQIKTRSKQIKTVIYANSGECRENVVVKLQLSFIGKASAHFNRYRATIQQLVRANDST